MKLTETDQSVPVKKWKKSKVTLIFRKKNILKKTFPSDSPPRKLRKLKLPARYYTTIGKLEFPGNFPSKDAIPDRKMWKTYIEFDHHQRINYRNIYVKCPCGKDDSYLISTVCREGWEYPVVICHNCGLIRAKYYWDEKGVIDFYSNWFHKKYGVSVLSEVEISPDKFFEIQKTKGKDIKSFVNEHTSKLNRPYTVVDIGGGSGGSLYSFLVTRSTKISLILSAFRSVVPSTQLSSIS